MKKVITELTEVRQCKALTQITLVAFDELLRACDVIVDLLCTHALEGESALLRFRFQRNHKMHEMGDGKSGLPVSKNIDSAINHLNAILEEGTEKNPHFLS